MDYKVLTAESKSRYEAARELEREVLKLLNQSWKLHGGVSITVTKYGYLAYYTLAQAMVK